MSARVLGRTRDLAFPADSTGLLLAAAFALIGYLAALGGLTLVLLGDDLRAWNRSLASSLTLQLPAETSAARLETTLALLRQTPGIAGARLLDPTETARLLEPWLGPAAAIDTLPVPRLIDIQTGPDGTVDVADLRQKLSSIAPGSQLDDHRPMLEARRRAAIRFAILIAIGIAAMAALAAVLSEAMSRLRLALHAGAVELLHLIGADDADIARPVQRDALRNGLLGGGVGAAAALLTSLVIGHLVPFEAAPSPADWRLWGVALAVTTVAGLGAMSAARLAVLRRLTHMP
jgi:cell division transport system permease protein